MTASTTVSTCGKPEPVWELATLFPPQGEWTEEEYISLTTRTNRLIELTDGHIEFLSMPTTSHQRIVGFLYQQIDRFVNDPRLGEVLFTGVRVRIRENKVREPDLVFMLEEHADRKHEDYWDGADLVIEVVSKDNPKRDHVTKVHDYAEAGIPECWIVDPQESRIVVLRLRGDSYVTHADVTGAGQIASVVLPDFAVEARDIWAAAAR